MLPNQLQLTFTDLSILDGRNTVRQVSLSRSERMHTIDIGIIRLRADKSGKPFNVRRQQGLTDELYEIKLGIPQLAEGIFNSNGPDDNIRGDFSNGLFYINGGERRFRALCYLIRQGKIKYPNGKFVSQVEVIQNPKEFTDRDRRRILFTSDSNLKYSILETAYGYLDWKQAEGISNHELSDIIRVSRQTVDNYILVTEMPVELQDTIESGDITLTEALKQYRQSKKPKKTVEVDLESGEIFETSAQEKARIEEEKVADKVRGDEEEFIDQDNTKTFPGSKGGFKEEGSGAITIGKDSIYMEQQKLNLWKQLVHRYEVLKGLTLDEWSSLENNSKINWEDMLAERLKNEYNLTVK